MNATPPLVLVAMLGFVDLARHRHAWGAQRRRGIGYAAGES